MSSDDRDLGRLIEQVLLRGLATPAAPSVDPSQVPLQLQQAFQRGLARSCAEALSSLMRERGVPQSARRTMKARLERMLKDGSQRPLTGLLPAAITEADLERILVPAIKSAIIEQSLWLFIAAAISGIFCTGSLLGHSRSGGASQPADEYDMVRRLNEGRAYDMRDVLAPTDDTRPASYTVSCDGRPFGSEEEQRCRYHVAERDWRGEVKNIRVLNHAEITDWLRYKAGMACWKVQERK